jgi:hypothetical protein
MYHDYVAIGPGWLVLLWYRVRPNPRMPAGFGA